MPINTDDPFGILKKKPKDRTLKDSQKEKLKQGKKNKCERCNKKFDSNLLVVHHKKPVAKYKTNDVSLSNFDIFYQKKKKPKYDYKSNLMVLCPTCHKIIHNDLSEKEKKKKKIIKKKKSKESWELDIDLKI